MPQYKVGPVTKEQAMAIDPGYVEYVTRTDYIEGAWEKYDAQKLKRGDIVLSRAARGKDMSICRVTSVKMNMLGENDVRVNDGAFSWYASSAFKLPK